jgi:8-hydroxy-5-deazaflavin:NADPH oxidoreductase
MRVAIVGSGHIGAGLARAWASAGHSVVFAALSPRDAALISLCASIGATADTTAAAAATSDVVVLAVPSSALDEVVNAIGALAGKVVIDCTNAVERGMTLKYGHTTSAAEELQRQLPEAHVFKSFNAQGAENLAHPAYGEVRATNLFCGDDLAGRDVVKQLVEGSRPSTQGHCATPGCSSP